MKKILAIAIVLGIFTTWYYWKNPLSAKVRIRDKVFSVDVAVTPKDRERGLSGRKNLGENRGMLFLFGSPGVYHFWMKDMQIPLDFIWITGSTIVDIDENIQPPKGEELPIELAPSQPIDKVLELNAGISAQYGIKTGDRVEYLQ